MRQYPVNPSMVVDCDTCPVREVQCDDCLVTALRGMPVVDLGMPDPEHPEHPEHPGHLDLDLAERRTAARLVAVGLVDAHQAAGATARREPWGTGEAIGRTGVRAVG